MTRSRTQGSPGRSRARQHGRRFSWLALPVGLALAGAALWALARDRQGAGAGAPLDEIDQASRARLEAVLHEAEREERGR